MQIKWNAVCPTLTLNEQWPAAWHVAEWHRFHTVLSATHTFIHEWNEPSCIYFVSIHQMASPEQGGAHLDQLRAYYSIYRPRKDEMLTSPSWLTYNRRFTHMVTRQLQVDRGTGKHMIQIWLSKSNWWRQLTSGEGASDRHSPNNPNRAFPVAAARAWNSLPSFVRDEQSLAAFRRQLKTVLFRTSFGEDANTWAASLLTRDCLVFVRWPCNVLCVIMPP